MNRQIWNKEIVVGYLTMPMPVKGKQIVVITMISHNNKLLGYKYLLKKLEIFVMIISVN